MYLRTALIIFLCIVQPFRCYDELDSSENPILEYLEMDPDSISEHELVKIDLSERLHKRGLGYGTPMSFQAFGNSFNLWLRPADPTFISDETPVYFANYVPGKNIPIEYVPVRDAMKNARRILQDPEHSASFVLGSSDFGRRTVTGYLRPRQDNSSLVIRSVPANVVQRYLRRRRSSDDFYSDFTNSTHHVVLKLKNDELLKYTTQKHGSGQVADTWSGHGIKFTGKEPFAVYPEILVHVDASYVNDWSRHGIDLFLEYILVLWNSVNLIYRHINFPTIKLNIGGIIIATNIHATPFIADNMITKNAFKIDETQAGAIWFYYKMYEIFPFYSYDMVVTMTKFAMEKDGVSGYGGVAEGGGACGQRFSALMLDNGVYSGIHTAAHEVAHLFGVYHDGNYDDCLPADGYIMSTTSKKRWTTFSPCSLNSFRRSYKAGNLQCMYNVPVVKGGKSLIRLPGTIFTLTEQCLAATGGQPCPPDRSNDICEVNYCSKKNDARCWPVDGALPGTPCLTRGDGRPGICLSNRCVIV